MFCGRDSYKATWFFPSGSNSIDAVRVTKESIIVWTSWLGVLSYKNPELDSGFRRSDDHGRARFSVVIPAESGIQDQEKIKSLSRLLWPQ